MTNSYHNETKWSDIWDGLGMSAFALLFLPGVALADGADKIRDFAKRDGARPSLFSFALKPLHVIAQAVADGAEIMLDKSPVTIGAIVTAAASGLFAGAKAAMALGFSWPTLVAGGHLAAMAGIGIAGLGVAVAGFPVALTAIGVAGTLTIGSALSVARCHRILGAAGAGLAETFRWRPEKKMPAPSAPAPAPSPAEDPLKPLSEAAMAFKAVIEAMESEEPEARVRFLTAQRCKYPAEFAEAARLEPHTPELRKDISVGKPLQFRSQKAPGLRRHLGGRSS